MPFNEFELMSYAFWQEEKQRIDEYQYLAWRITIAPHLDPKMIPTSFEKFKGLGGGKPKDKARQREMFLKEMDKFNKIQENGG